MAQAVRVCGSGSGRFSVLGSMQAGDITLNERLFPAGYRECRHEHFRPYFSVVMSGEYSEVDGPCSQTYKGRCLGFQPVGEHESRVYGEPVQTLVIEFPAALASDRAFAAPSSSVVSAAATKLYREFRTQDRFSGLAIQGLLLELIAETARNYETSRIPPRWLRRAEELMRLRYAEGLTLDEIAREVGVHAVSLARAFRRHHGQTMGEAMRRYRIEKAQEMIRLRQGSLAEIAADTGFTDQSHFSRVFRRIAGTSPASYRDHLG